MTNSKQQQDQVNRIEKKKNAIINKQAIIFIRDLLNKPDDAAYLLQKHVEESEYEILMQQLPLDKLTNQYTIIAKRLNVIVHSHSFTINFG